jgi:DNA primase
MSPARHSSFSRTRPADELQVLNAATDLYANRLCTDEVALDYMSRRGFPRHLLQRYRVGYAHGDELIPYLRWRRLPLRAAVRTGLLTPDGREFLAGRITFPEARAGQAIWLIGRVLETENGQSVVSGPKYLGLPGSKPLLGWEEAIRDPRAVCVVEGPVDLLALRLWGLPGIAIVGTMLRQDKLEQLDRFQFLYLALDPDEGGRKGTAALIDRFGSRALPVELPFGDDVGKLATYKDGQARFRAAVRAALDSLPASEIPSRSLPRVPFN